MALPLSRKMLFARTRWLLVESVRSAFYHVFMFTAILGYAVFRLELPPPDVSRSIGKKR